MRKLKTLTSLTNHWQKAGAIHSLAWIPQSIQMIFLGLLDGWLIWREHPCSFTKQSLMIVSHCAKLSGFYSLSYSIAWFQAWGKDAARDTHNMTSSATLALLCVTLAVVLRTTCWVLMSPAKSQIGRLETGFSPWLCDYLAVWPCTSYFTSLGFGFLHYKMKEPKLKIFYDF